MAKVRYIGPHDAVAVPDPLGGEQVCARGDVISVSEPLAASLLDQRLNWEDAAPDKNKPESEAAAKRRELAEKETE